MEWGYGCQTNIISGPQEMLSGKGIGFEYIGFCILVDAVMPWQNNR